MLKIKKLAALAAASLLASISLFSCSDDGPPADAKEMKVTFLETGKADAIVIQSETGTVVIDCGEKGDGNGGQQENFLHSLSPEFLRSVVDNRILVNKLTAHDRFCKRKTRFFCYFDDFPGEIPPPTASANGFSPPSAAIPDRRRNAIS